MMRFTLATSIVALAVLTAAAPQPAGEKIGVAIPISKRSGLVNGGSVNTEALNSHVASTQAYVAFFHCLTSTQTTTYSKVLRGLKRFEKNTGIPYRATSKGIQRRATGADALTNDDNKLWYGAISVGTPAKTFTGKLSWTFNDRTTHSFWQWTSTQVRGTFPWSGTNGLAKLCFSDLFLPGPKCDSSCSGHAIYSPSASSTAQDLGQTFSHSYEDGATVSGQLFADTVSVAGLTVCSVFVLDIRCLTPEQVTGQTLGAASKYSSNLAPDQFPADGVMGLAFQSISAYNAAPVVQTLISQGQIDAPVFSFKLATTGSELYLGGANPALYTGSFAYTPVTQQVSCRLGMILGYC